MEEQFEKDKEKWGDEVDQETAELNKKLDDQEDSESSDMFDEAPPKSKDTKKEV
jgi:hypothetical protein